MDEHTQAMVTVGLQTFVAVTLLAMVYYFVGSIV